MLLLQFDTINIKYNGEQFKSRKVTFTHRKHKNSFVSKFEQSRFTTRHRNSIIELYYL
jgi:hypothetical protein